jgi:FixJ family two-component response regulator
MPRQGGDDALSDMRALGYGGPVIRWSGYAPNEASPHSHLPLLRKPFSSEELLVAVQKALAASSSANG